MSYKNIREEELKNKIAQDYFNIFDCTRIVGNIDFCVTLPTQSATKGLSNEEEALLWAEAKKGKADIFTSIVQLILTIGKARTFDKFLPPAFLGAFDAEKFAFISYNEIHDIFYINDFNWNVTPSNHETKEFKQVYEKVKSTIEKNSLLFSFDTDENELHTFIKANFILGKTDTSKIRIDKNNFMVIYNKWLSAVKPSIAIDWDIAKRSGIIDGDFYLADILSKDNESLKEKLYVLLKHDRYEFDRKLSEAGFINVSGTGFSDKQKAHNLFWNKYERPPREEYWDYIVGRRDLLVPQDVRERKGSFFTPLIWVELSQKYLADVLGVDWQDEYYIWDCAAGTGNLLIGLTNKYNIWASTLDKQDVDVMKDGIKNGANLLEDHVFQFDFINDDFDKLPIGLQKIINDPEKRKKLVMYINPPYAEATTARTVTGTGENKAGVATENKFNILIKSKIGNATNEIFALFMAKIYSNMPSSILAQFSKLKFIQGTNFIKFKEYFLADYKSGFIVPADSFDNVKGNFPIGFTVWDTNSQNKINNIECNIYDKNGINLGKKTFYGELPPSINRWIKSYDENNQEAIGYMENPAPDFQNNNFLCITTLIGTRHVNYFNINSRNIIAGVVYFTIRQVFEPTWLNDRDQFLYPNDGWKSDTVFQNDCLAFALFHGQNRISSSAGVNHWIPFTEYEVGARDKFESSFMTNYIQGKIKPQVVSEPQMFYFSEKSDSANRTTPLEFSDQAEAVFASGLELWKYYHAQPNVNVNASLYDIREYFQGRNATGKMKNKSEDETYTNLIADLRNNLKLLAKKIEPKVYKYGFLKG